MINKTGLRELKRVLLAIPDEKRMGFNMSTWGEPSTAGPCGTIRCAAGYAGSDLYFQNKGFYLVDSDDPHESTDEVDPRDGNVCPVFMDQVGFDALALFFNMNQILTFYLFDSKTYLTPRQRNIGLLGIYSITPETVVARIDKLLKYGEEAPKHDESYQSVCDAQEAAEIN